MAKKTTLDEDVVKFLIDNPKELQHVKSIMIAHEHNAKWQEDCAERRKNAKMIECGTYGCKELKLDVDPFCEKCYEEYRDDPEAFR